MAATFSHREAGRVRAQVCPAGYVMATIEMLPVQQVGSLASHVMRDSLSLLVSPYGVYGKLAALIF